jgi:hypothetical protein
VADELRINTLTKPLPFVNVACSARGTIARIDSNSGQVFGEYMTAPETFLGTQNPSRTTVDRFGNVWVANRDASSVSKIGIVIGGIRADRSGVAPNWVFTANPRGQYVLPPYTYNTCMDNDNDGAIKTSLGLENILPWPDAAGEDQTDGGIDTTDDEAVLNFVLTGTFASGPRTIAVDHNNDVWVGGFNDQIHQHLHGTTGAILWTSGTLPSGGYGGVINYVAGERWLWSTKFDNNIIPQWPSFIRIKLSDKTVLTSDPAYNAFGDYGLAVDPSTQHVWVGKGLGSHVSKFPLLGGEPETYFGASPIKIHKGMVIDHNANLWVAHGDHPDTGGSRSVGHLKTDGTWIGNVTLVPNDNMKAGPTGVAIDQNQKVWVANRHGNNAMRINPNAGPYSGINNEHRIGAVDLTVDLGTDDTHPNDEADPYNYSDMTGFVTLASTLPSGSWVYVQDGGADNKSWNKLSWTSTTPSGSGITVEVRAANTLAGLPGVNRTHREFRKLLSTENGVAFTPPVEGRFLEVRVSIWRNPDSSAVPVLSSLTVHCPTN